MIPGKGAVGIENTLAVTADGGEKITAMPDPIVVPVMTMRSER